MIAAGVAGGTIVALSSGRPPAGIAVVRASGPAAATLVAALTGAAPAVPRRARLTRLRDPADGRTIDEALVLWFPRPHSATGEDVAEFHVHGGRAVLEALLAAATRVPDVRLAEAGEFSRRAFAHGKLDLTAIEGLGDLIEAATEAQRRQALDQMQGRLATLYEGWRSDLIGALAAVEADLDFAEGEDDVPAGLDAEVRGTVRALVAAIDGHLADARRGERLRDGLTVAVVGAPNAGKSSLINMLTQRDVAIVSPEPGTTRDVIEAHLDLGGFPVTLIDTAGLREIGDAVESEGVRRARARAASADLVVQLSAPDAPSPPLPGAWQVASKIDLHGAPAEGLGVSTMTGEGVASLVAALTRWAAEALAPGEAPLLTRARHREALVHCRAAMGDALAVRGDLVLVAEGLRAAAHALGRITGRVDVEDVLDQVFSRFCIGK